MNVNEMDCGKHLCKRKDKFIEKIMANQSLLDYFAFQ